ncbi:hypothetical protein QQF64_010795 [Cirrhinus molitorella]|uniref:Uncharacterized protein n=1 Tax=Cirrhinus molitorella TaxID=172907 RepID=A0ABR3LZU3_9TELE
MAFLSLGWNENRAERKNATSSLCLPRPGSGCLLRVKRCSLVTRCGRLLGSPDGQSSQMTFRTLPVPTFFRSTSTSRSNLSKRGKAEISDCVNERRARQTQASS